MPTQLTNRPILFTHLPAVQQHLANMRPHPPSRLCLAKRPLKLHHSNFSILINPMARGGYDTTGLHPLSAGYLARPQPPVPTYQFQLQPQPPSTYTFINGAFVPFGIMHSQQHVFQPQAHPAVTQAMFSWQPLGPQPHAQIRWP